MVKRTDHGQHDSHHAVQHEDDDEHPCDEVLGKRDRSSRRKSVVLHRTVLRLTRNRLNALHGRAVGVHRPRER